jgi:hypothetical protein
MRLYLEPVTHTRVDDRAARSAPSRRIERAKAERAKAERAKAGDFTGLYTATNMVTGSSCSRPAMPR